MATRILTAFFAGAAALAVAAPAMAQFMPYNGNAFRPTMPYYAPQPSPFAPQLYHPPIASPQQFPAVPQPQPVIIAPTGNGQFLLRPY